MSEPGQERRTCPNCGAELDATANFCPSCGTAQEPQVELPEGPPPPIPEPGRIETPEVPGVPPPPQGAAPPPSGRGPLTFIGISCGALLLMFVLFAGCVALLGTGSQDETASVEVTEESAEEEPTEESEPSVPEDSMPEDTRPTPRTPEERVRRNIEDKLDPVPDSETKSLEDLQITSRANGCLDVYVTFKAMGILRDWSADL